MRIVRYFIIAIVAIAITSCVRYQPIGSDISYNANDFINLCMLTNCISVDTNTDVLYYHNTGITPIMKADGTCLTLTEWKSMRGINNERKESKEIQN